MGALPYARAVVRYEEGRVSGRAWMVLAIVCLLAWLAMTVAFPGPSSLIVATVLVGMLGAIAVLSVAAVGFFGIVRVSDVDLRVGRKRFVLADLEPGSVRGPGQVLSAAFADGSDSFALGNAAVGLRRRDGRPVVIVTKDPAALRAALEQALGVIGETS